MITVDSIQNGFVIDHIRAGLGLALYRLLELDKQGVPVVLITGARSRKYGTKDMIKIEGAPDMPELGILAALDARITVLRIRDGAVAERIVPKPPRRLINVVQCKSPRCITSCEEGIDHIFERGTDGAYRCLYCARVLAL